MPLLDPCRSLLNHETIDWPNFLARHDMVWDRVPHRWENGVFLGNGLLGTLMHADLQTNRVRWWFCRSDVGRMDVKLPDMVYRKVIGALDLIPACSIADPQSTQQTASGARLHLWDAEATGQVDTRRGRIKWCALASQDPNVVAIELKPEWEELACRWEPIFNDDGQRSANGDTQLYIVPDDDDVRGGGYAVAWRETKLNDDHRVMLFSIGGSPRCRATWAIEDDGRSAQDEALEAIDAVDARDLDAIRAPHRQRWHDYYTRSFVSFANTELASHYWIQLYKLRAAGRPDGPMIDNHGPWSTETRYGFATWDMNVQAINRLHLPSNHLDQGDALARFMRRNYNRQTMHHAESGELRAGVTHQTFLRVADPHEAAECDGASKLLWACHNLWLQYRFTMDRALLEPLADQLEGGINAFVAHTKRGDDGKLHVPSGRSWEAVNDVPDPLVYIAIVDWALRCRMGIDELLGREPDARWSQLLAQLPEYAQGPEGFYLAPGYPPMPHRHWSHLKHIWPFHTYTWDDPANRDMIQKSVDHWVDLSAGTKGEMPMAGFAVAAAIQLYAHMNQPARIPQLAEVFLREWSKRGPCCWASTLYREHGPVIESPLLFADALLSTMIQSWGGIIRVFPAWPAAWGDAVFHQLRAEGNFAVSAAMQDERVSWVAITSHSGEPCRLRVDMADVNVHGLSADAVTREDDGQTLRIDLPAESSVMLTAGEVEPPVDVQPVEADEAHCNMFGLNERFLAKRHGKEQLDRLSERGRGLTAW